VWGGRGVGAGGHVGRQAPQVVVFLCGCVCVCVCVDRLVYLFG
jgi:hypothetical protein